jgi:signal transduction histidine kinase
VWFLVLSLVPLFLSNTVGYQVTRRIIERQARAHLVAWAGAEARHVASEVDRHQRRLEAAVTGDRVLAGGMAPAARALRGGDLERVAISRLHALLDRKLEELGGFSELFVMDEGGRVVASTAPRRLNSDWSMTELAHLGGQGRYFTEDLESYGGLLTPVYRLATPVRTPGGDVVGVLVATVGFDRLENFFRIADHVAGDIHAYVLDERGGLLAASHPRPGIEYGRPFASAFTSPDGEPVRRYENFEGVPVLAAAAVVEAGNRRWRYVAEAPEASVLGPLRGLAVLAGVLEATFALLLVAVVWMVARSIVTPLRHLVAGAERIRAGELGDLGRTFNQMSQELGASTRRIQELHDQEMRRAAQLASVGELASGIAHEIKNPLIGVMSGLDLLGKHAGTRTQVETLTGQMREQLGRIESAIRDLLSYARPKAPHRMWTDPNRLVDRVAGLLAPQAEAAGVRIETRLSPSVPKVEVDPELMTQTLVNLALNGIQAMGPGGVLTFATDPLGREVRLMVRDTGSGIPEDQLEQIFRPFYTTKHRGTGLGLAITRGIVERHGGRLTVESEVGSGSTFTIVFQGPDGEASLP